MSDTPPDPLDFLRKFWAPFGLPGTAMPGEAVSELDRRIGELGAVEQWLSLNQSMLRMQIEALKMQRAAMAAMPGAAAPGGHPGEGGGGANPNPDLFTNPNPFTDAWRQAFHPQPASAAPTEPERGRDKSG